MRHQSLPERSPASRVRTGITPRGTAQNAPPGRHGQSALHPCLSQTANPARGDRRVDELFEIDEIVASGLLPPERIGAPPVYDRRGRVRAVLPAQLARIHATLAPSPSANLQEIWQAISAAEIFNACDDPSADDLLAPAIWAQISALPASVLSIAPTTWTLYLGRARAVLRRHATLPVADPHCLPPHLEAMVASQPQRLALKALWHRVTTCELHGIKKRSPAELLEIEIWRALWQPRTNDLSTTSLRQYEMTARNILVRHTSIQNDPLRRVRRSWSNLPKSFVAALAPIRKAAETALLRPEEITSDWLTGMGFQQTALATLSAARDSRDAALVAASVPVTPDPVAVAWQALREAARARGIDTSRLGVIATPAIRDGRCPRSIDRTWASRISAGLSQRKNAKFMMELRRFDAMFANPALRPLLGTGPVGKLPDRRRKGNLELPKRISRKLDSLGSARGHSANTRRANKSIMCELYTRAVEQGRPAKGETLTGLLLSAAQLGMTGRKLHRAEALLRNVIKEEVGASKCRAASSCPRYSRRPRPGVQLVQWLLQDRYPASSEPRQSMGDPT